MGEGDDSAVTQNTCQSHWINLDGAQVCTGLEPASEKKIPECFTSAKSYRPNRNSRPVFQVLG